MTYERAAPRVRIEPWTAADLWLLHRTNTPEMTEHLGGPETAEQVTARHRRYLDLGGVGRMFRIALLPEDGREGGVAGSIGFWELTWQGEKVYETGWGVLPEFQGRGIAVAAAREVIAAAGAEGRYGSLHAFPSVAHAASNAVCRKAGFGLVGECAFEYPKGHVMRSNEWRVDLSAERTDRRRAASSPGFSGGG